MKDEKNMFFEIKVDARKIQNMVGINPWQ